MRFLDSLTVELSRRSVAEGALVVPGYVLVDLVCIDRDSRYGRL